MTDQDIITDILKREGGYTDHPADRGGPTKFGITLSTLSTHRARSCNVDELKALTEGEARAIYEERYIIAPKLNRIIDGTLRGLVVDAAVNHGAGRAVKMLQAAVGADQDGIIGPKTIGAILALGSKAVYLRFCAERIRFYGQIISNDHSQAVFAQGWLNRATEFLDTFRV